MPFSGTGTGIQNATDVFLSAVTADDLLKYNSSTAKWMNSSLSGLVALPIKGGLETVSTNNAATGTVTLNLINGNVFSLTLTGSITLTFSGATAGKACSFTVYLKQDGTGGRTVTWPSSTKWSGGAPTLSTAANAVDILVFESIDGGATWFGSLVGTNFA